LLAADSLFITFIWLNKRLKIFYYQVFIEDLVQWIKLIWVLLKLCNTQNMRGMWIKIDAF
jgi:hypothetical protein